MKEELIKEKMLTEFREWFCDGYCQFYDIDDYYTDIITFDYCEGDRLSGDLFISLDTIRTNAEQFGASYDNELHRVIIHGILHLCGINDKGPGEREIMEGAENKALSIRKV